MFCGRVFIFLFQSFPLGDKSAVNLRGEYHTENVTTFDDISKHVSDQKQEMEVDMPDERKDTADTEGEKSESEKPQKAPVAGDDSQEMTQDDQKPPKVTISEEEKEEDKDVDLDTLYPMFWGLQAYFSSPTKMFDHQHFVTFKTGLESTLSAFKSVNTDLETQSASRTSEERRPGKRKRMADGAEIASSFNPKYLTSRDLFDLEVRSNFRFFVLLTNVPLRLMTLPSGGTFLSRLSFSWTLCSP